jgi:acyl carrier protein
VPIGRPLANTSVYIVDSSLQAVPAGIPGELCIGGVGVARGYLNRPELTEERFVPDPFADTPGALLYKTGDLARWLPDGNVDFIGRTDRQVKIRGFRIEPGEVEAALERREGVESASVVVREDRPGDVRLVAYLIASPGHAIVADDLRNVLAEQLPAYMVPAAFVTVEEFPLTPNGKIDRDALPEPPAHQAALDDDFVEPASETEQIIADIWCDILSLESVGATENFFALGGHSLLATRVLARMRQTFEVELTLRTVFEHPTVAGLARAVESGQRESVPALTALDRSQNRVALPVSWRAP